ncbi:MAG: Spy/CpxP family protein refolding chaperone [Alphaproteobacteria bacterium]
MRKALLPMVASLALCGAATATLIATNANAAQTAKPLMLALIGADAGAPKPVMIAQLAPGEGGGRAEGPPGPPPPDGMMMDRGARRGQMCQDMYARKVGELAFLETKLALTGAQAPLFARWKQASLDVAKRHESECATRVKREPGQRRDLVQRLDLEEAMLKRRLADIGAERPSLTAFYASLNTEQKQEFGHAAMRAMGGRMHMMMGMMGGRHPGMGPEMGRGPMDHGPMGDMPPPPAPQ